MSQKEVLSAITLQSDKKREHISHLVSSFKILQEKTFKLIPNRKEV